LPGTKQDEVEHKCRYSAVYGFNLACVFGWHQGSFSWRWWCSHV